MLVSCQNILIRLMLEWNFWKHIQCDGENYHHNYSTEVFQFFLKTTKTRIHPYICFPFCYCFCIVMVVSKIFLNCLFRVSITMASSIWSAIFNTKCVEKRETKEKDKNTKVVNIFDIFFLFDSWIILRVFREKMILKIKKGSLDN